MPSQCPSSIDVIVPCYASGRFLRQCVEIVPAEVDLRVRMLIIDDASPDNSHDVAEDLVRTDSRVTVVRHSEYKGYIAAYNEGIDWVSADYMLLLSADDYVLPGALGRAACLLDAHQEVEFTYGRAVEFLGAGADGNNPITPAADDRSGWRIVSGREFLEISGARKLVRTPTAQGQGVLLPLYDSLSAVEQKKIATVLMQLCASPGRSMQSVASSMVAGATT